MMRAGEVRRLALSLPEAVERETWGHPTFRVREKIFATLAPNGTTAGVKASTEEQSLLIASDPETFAPSDYVGRFGWVTVRLDKVDPDLLSQLIVDAWRRTAPKRVAAAYEKSVS